MLSWTFTAVPQTLKFSPGLLLHWCSSPARSTSLDLAILRVAHEPPILQDPHSMAQAHVWQPHLFRTLLLEENLRFSKVMLCMWAMILKSILGLVGIIQKVVGDAVECYNMETDWFAEGTPSWWEIEAVVCVVMRCERFVHVVLTWNRPHNGVWKKSWEESIDLQRGWVLILCQ